MSGSTGGVGLRHMLCVWTTSVGACCVLSLHLIAVTSPNYGIVNREEKMTVLATQEAGRWLLIHTECLFLMGRQGRPDVLYYCTHHHYTW